MARICPRCKTNLVTRKVKIIERDSKPVKSEGYTWPPKRDASYETICPKCGYIPRKELKKERDKRRKQKRNHSR